MPRRLTQAEIDAAGGGVPVAAPGPRKMTSAEIAAAGGGEDAPAQAFGEGLADSATFGAGKEFLKGFYQGSGTAATPEQAAAQMSGRAEVNPLAHGAGEFAGFFTPGPGAISAAAKGGAAALKVGKFATRAAQGGIEGGIFGLSAAINDETMGDPQLTAEHLAAGTFGGALAGAGVNTVFGKFGDLGRSALIKAFGGTAVKDKLGEMAENMVMRSVTNASDMTKKRLRGRANEVGRFAIDEGFTKGGAGFATASERAATRADDAWQSIEGSLDVADTMVPFEPSRAAVRMQTIVDEMKNNPAMGAARTKLQTFVDEFTHASPNAPKTFAKAWETASDTLDEVGEKFPTKGLKSKLFKMRGELQDEIFQQVAAVDPKLGEGLKTANRDYANAATFRDLAMKKADSVGRGFNISDVGAGGAALAAGAGPLGLVAPFITRAARERGGFVVASAMDALSNSGALPKIANSFQLLMKSRLATPGFAGPFRAALETAAANGAESLLQTHLSMAHDPEYMAAVGLEHEDPQTVASHVDRAHRLAQLSNTVDEAGQEADQSVMRALTGGESPKLTRRDASREEFESIKAKLKVMAADDGAIRKQLTDLAPTTSGLATTAITAGAEHLLATAPRNPTENLPPALQRPWKPGAGELRSWFRRVETVADPRSVLEAMNGGIVSSEAIDTLRQVYPRLYRDFQEKMTERLSAWDKPLDRARRGRISQLLGSLDNPAVAQLIQAAHARSNPPAGGAAVGGPDGREKIDVDKNLQTQAQRLENR